MRSALLLTALLHLSPASPVLGNGAGDSSILPGRKNFAVGGHRLHMCEMSRSLDVEYGDPCFGLWRKGSFL